MTCDCCSAAMVAPDYRRYDPLCLWCGARLIRRLGRWNMSKEKLVSRRQKVLADWISYGHDELELRRLAKQPECFDPSGLEKVSETIRRKSAKRR